MYVLYVRRTIGDKIQVRNQGVNQQCQLTKTTTNSMGSGMLLCYCGPTENAGGRCCNCTSTWAFYTFKSPYNSPDDGIYMDCRYLGGVMITRPQRMSVPVPQHTSHHDSSDRMASYVCAQNTTMRPRAHEKVQRIMAQSVAMPCVHVPTKSTPALGRNTYCA